jgi:thiol:disulfide interchange protein DsbA
MNRKIMMFFIGSVIVLAWVMSTPVVAATYKEGEAYELVKPVQPTSSGNKVEVVELFWYGCPHCYQFEPYVKRWLKDKPENVDFVRIPGVFRPDWALYGRAFYTANIMGVFDKIHEPLFEAIHELKRPLSSEDALAKFFAEHGVDEQEFHKVFRSFTVESKIRRAMDLGKRYGANGVPTMIVNGKYRTSASSAGSHAEVLKVVDYLIKKESN